MTTTDKDNVNDISFESVSTGLAADDTTSGDEAVYLVIESFAEGGFCSNETGRSESNDVISSGGVVVTPQLEEALSGPRSVTGGQ